MSFEAIFQWTVKRKPCIVVVSGGAGVFSFFLRITYLNDLFMSN